MILETMTQPEIAKHVRREFIRNLDRISTKLDIVQKKLARTGITTFSYDQVTANRTCLTIYIPDSRVEDIIIGAWYKKRAKLLFASLTGSKNITFYTDHFFSRFAERFLKADIDIRRAAHEFFKRRLVFVDEEHADKATDEHKIPLTVHYNEGLGIGLRDKLHEITIMKTFISRDTLGYKKRKMLRKSEARRKFLLFVKHKFPKEYKRFQASKVKIEDFLE